MQSMFSRLVFSSVALSAALAAPALACSSAFTIIPGTAGLAVVSPKADAAPFADGVLGLTLRLGDEPLTPERQANAKGFVGLWDARYYLKGQLIDEGFDAIHSDGTEILVDTSAPATDNVCMGTWEEAKPFFIKIKHPSWQFDLNGNLIYVVIFHETLWLDPGGQTFEGTEYVDGYDTNGNYLGRSPEIKIKATRIRAY